MWMLVIVPSIEIRNSLMHKNAHAASKTYVCGCVFQDEGWHGASNKDANLSDLEDWLDDDVNDNIPTVVVSPSEQGKSLYRKTSAKENIELKLGFAKGEEVSFLLAV